ncbi:unnamed protein product [Amoebophrya sp. A25]|nr:unnamed protein product [Amoebophrya sp. A25]|eukprot:GSA25T00020109001.1
MSKYGRSSQEASGTKIFVGGLAQGTTEAQIHEHFQQFGKIEKSELFILRGFGYVSFTASSAVDRCLAQQYGQHQINGKWVDVKKSYPPRDVNLPVKKGSGKDSTSKSGEKGSREERGPSKGDSKAAPTVSVAAASKKPMTVTATVHGPRAVEDSRVTELCAMGFSLRQTKRVLGTCGWDMNKALDQLLQEGVDPDEKPEETRQPSKGKAGAETLSTASDSIEERDDMSNDGRNGGKGGKKGAKSSPGKKDQGSSSTSATGASSTAEASETSAQEMTSAEIITTNVNVMGNGSWSGAKNKQSSAPRVDSELSQHVDNSAAKTASATANSAAAAGATAGAGVVNSATAGATNGAVNMNLTAAAVVSSTTATSTTPSSAVSNQHSKASVPGEQPGAHQGGHHLGGTSPSKMGAMHQMAGAGNAAAQQQISNNMQHQQQHVAAQQQQQHSIGAQGAAQQQHNVAGAQQSAQQQMMQQQHNMGAGAAQQQMQMGAQQQQHAGMHQQQAAGQPTAVQQGQQHVLNANNVSMLSNTTQHTYQNDTAQKQPEPEPIANNTMVNSNQNGWGNQQMQMQNGQAQQNQYGNYYNQQQNQQMQQQQSNAQYGGNYYGQQYGNQQQQQQNYYQQQQQQQQQYNQQAQQPQQQQQQREETGKIHVQPTQAYAPPQEYVNGGQQFLTIQPDLKMPIELQLYNSNDSGWSHGRDAQGNSGWFPTSCARFDIVVGSYGFDTKPESTRNYITFQPGSKIIVEQRHDCGWWIGAVVLDSHGNLGGKGYFPGNYCQDAPPAAQ